MKAAGEADRNREKELWSAFTRGDENAFSQLYRRMYRPLYSYGINCGLDADQANDALQEVFTRIYNRPSLVREAVTIRPMLYRCVRNHALNSILAGKRNASMDDIPEAFNFTVAADEHIVAMEERQRIEETVRRMLETLTARQRELLYLRFTRDLDYDEIAELMGITNQGARNMMHKMMLRLRRINTEDTLLLIVWLVASRDHLTLP